MKKRPTIGDRFGFTDTHWSLLGAALESSQARSRLLARYYRPAREYLLMLTGSSDKAEEALQSFFAVELERLVETGKGGVVRGADRTKGRFRDYLKASLQNHWLGMRRKEQTGPTLVAAPEAEAWDRFDMPKQEDPERAYYKACIQQLVAEALRRVEAVCGERGQQSHLDLFLAHYLPAAGADGSWEAIARRFRLANGKTARNRAQTVAAHFRAALGELLAEEDARIDLSQEIHDLLSILGDGHD